MSSEKPLVVNRFAPGMKDAAIVFGWISALILIAALSWYFTQPLRGNFLLKAINRVLEQSGDSRRLGTMLPPDFSGAGSPGTRTLGTWFTVTEFPGRQDTGGVRAFVFVFIGEGYFFPCAAMVSPSGNVTEFIPLNDHGKRMIKRVSSGIIKIYSSRIEGINL